MAVERHELVKRTRLANVHAHIIGYLKSQMPTMMGKASKQKELIETLPAVFRKVATENNLPPGDFPELEAFRNKLKDMDFSVRTPERTYCRCEMCLVLNQPRAAHEHSHSRS